MTATFWSALVVVFSMEDPGQYELAVVRFLTEESCREVYQDACFQSWEYGPPHRRVK